VPAKGSVVPAASIYLLCFIVSFASWRYSELSGQFSVSQNQVFLDGEYWRLFTALFAHSDIVHLLSNGPLLVIFGWLLRAFFGLGVFPILAVLVGAITNLAVIRQYPPDVHLLGASGMVYAMAGMWLTFYLKFEQGYSFNMRLVRVVGFILIVLFPTTFQPTTSYLAHTLGFVFGMIAAGLLVLNPWFRDRIKIDPVPEHDNFREKLLDSDSPLQDDSPPQVFQ
jgi:rhomboid protease GluP